MNLRDATLLHAARATVNAADAASVTGIELGPLRNVTMRAEVRITAKTGSPTAIAFAVYKASTLGGTYNLLAVSESKTPAAGDIYTIDFTPEDNEAFFKIACYAITNAGGSIDYRAGFHLA